MAAQLIQLSIFLLCITMFPELLIFNLQLFLLITKLLFLNMFNFHICDEYFLDTEIHVVFFLNILVFYHILGNSNRIQKVLYSLNRVVFVT